MTSLHHLKLNTIFKYFYTHKSHSILITILEADAFIIHIFTEKTNSENLIISQDHTGNKWPSKKIQNGCSNSKASPPTHTHTSICLCLPSSCTIWPITSRNNFSSSFFLTLPLFNAFGCQKKPQISLQVTILEIGLMLRNSKGGKNHILCNRPLKFLKVS